MRRVEHAVDLAKRRPRVADSSAPATHSFSNTSNCVRKSRTRWCNSGLLIRSPKPGEPLITTTGDFSAYAPAMELHRLRAADAVRHAHRAHAVDAGIGIGRKAGAVLARAADHADRALRELIVEGQHVVARNAEHIAHAVVLQPANQVLADREPAHVRSVGYGAAWRVGESELETGVTMMAPSSRH